MTAVIVISVILLILLLILITRASLHLEYQDAFNFSVSVLKIPIYDSAKPKKSKKDTKARLKKEPSKKQDNFFVKLYKEKGLTTTISFATDILKSLINSILWLLKRLKIRNFRINLSVRGYDAADTAIKYGAVCSSIYPIIGFADTNLNFKAKAINIYSDFEGDAPPFSFSVDIKAEIFVLLTVLVKAFCEYKKFKDVLNNEREN